MYIEFITEYWYLFAMLFVIVLLLSFDSSKHGMGGAKSVTPTQLPQLQARQNVVIVDVNQTDKFKNGHISQSMNLPFEGFTNSIGKLKKHKDKPIVLTCDTGAHSKKVAPLLIKNEFSDVYVLSGGLAAWRKDNLPLVKG